MATYFPVSQDINSDGEVWELTDFFGDRALRIWLEILGIMDRQKNRWRLVSGWDSVIARKVRQSPATVRRVVGWMLANHWLEVRQLSTSGQPEVLALRNYAKYRKVAAEASLSPNLPNRPNLTDPDPTASAASPDLPFSVKNNGRQSMGKSMNLIPELKKETDRLYGSDPVKFKRLAAWVSQGRKHEFSESDMAEALRQFWDYRMVDDWYPYLDSILDKVVTDRNRDASLAEHRERRAEEARPLQGVAGTLTKGLLPDAKKG